MLTDEIDDQLLRLEELMEMLRKTKVDMQLMRFSKFICSEYLNDDPMKLLAHFKVFSEGLCSEKKPKKQ